MSSRRVVITGIGAITPIGTGAEDLWRGVTANRSAVRAIDRAASQAVLGDLYLHRHDGQKRRLLEARRQQSNRKLPSPRGQSV